MLLNSAKAELDEKKFLEECGGFDLYYLIGKKYGISLNTFCIIFFSYFLYYTNEKASNKLNSLIARIAFAVGYLFGIWLSQKRVINIKKFVANCLIFYNKTPNQSKHSKIISNIEEFANSCQLTTYIRLKNIILGNGPYDSIFEVKKRNKKTINFPSLFEITRLIHHCYSAFQACPRVWFGYGIVVSPLLNSLTEASDKLASEWNGNVVYFTQASGMTSIMAESFKKLGIKTVIWHHGTVGMPMLSRSICDEAMVYSINDINILRKYSFENKILLQPSRSSLVTAHSYLKRKSNINKIGYATNLLCVLGGNAHRDEIQNPQLIDDGIICNKIVYEYVMKAKPQSLYLKIHPRESIKTYKKFMALIKQNSNCKALFVENFEEIVDNVDHCICHPTSLADELLERGIRVYIYRSIYGNFDSESSLGKIVTYFGFDSYEDVLRLINMPDKDYWRLFSNLYSPTTI